MMNSPSETVILCEGYHDRSFWHGLLEDAGYIDARPKRTNGSLGKAIDPFNKPVEGGDFAFLSSEGAFVRVKPCQGAPKVVERAKMRLGQRTTEPVAHLIINLDTDATDSEDDATAKGKLVASMRDRIRALAADFVEEEPGDMLIDNRSTRISIVLWSAPEPAMPELPDKQTLERLLCAALRDVYPERATKIAEWLAARPGSPPVHSKSYKAHAWLQMGGWYPEYGCDAFYRNVWQLGPVRDRLRERVRRLFPESLRNRFMNGYSTNS